MLWSRNLQLLYPFQNTALDYSGNARNGTVNGSGVYATKPNGGRCLYFDGVGDYVKTPSFGLSGTVFVFAADVRCKYSTATRQTLLSDNSTSATVGYLWLYRETNSNNLRWRYADGVAPTAGVDATSFFAAPYNDVWLHLLVACDYNGKNTYFYRNGILFATIAMSNTPVFPSTNNAKYLGIGITSAYLLTAGYLANVQIWTLATMPAAAQMLANANRIMLGMNPIW